MNSLSSANHVIRRQTMELILSSEEGAYPLQESIRRIVYDHVIPMIDEVLSSLAAHDEVVHLDRVEIDLGDISSANLEDQLVDRSRARLQEVLVKELRALRKALGTSVGGRIVRPQESRLELIRVFLQSGAVPWWTPGSASVDLESVFHDLLDTAMTEVVSMLRDIVAPSIVDRIVKQFSPELRKSLLVALAPAQAVDLEKAISQWLRVLLEDRPDLIILGENFSDKQSVARFVEARTLEHVATHKAQPVTAAALSQNLMEELAIRQRMDMTDFVQILAERAHRALSEDAYVGIWLKDKVASLLDPRAADPSAGYATDTKIVTQAEIAEAGRRRGRATRHSTVADRQETQNIERSESQEMDGSASAEVSGPYGGSESIKPLPSLASSQPDKPLDQQETVPTSGVQKAFSALQRQFIAEDGQYIDNAGLVIVWPYLIHFFEKVDVVKDKAFRSEMAQERAVLLLQHLATGGAEWPEPVLLLNKILCGWAHLQPVAKSIEVTGAEAEESRELLAAVVRNWKVLKSTSIDGLRVSFLQRDGRLMRVDEGWKLKVARTGYDVLLDQLPWGIGFVLLPWMEQPLFVEW